MAYVGLFGLLNFHTRFSPAFVYSNNCGNGAGFIAEVASHESGHNLGLSHDGTSSQEYYMGHGSGETSWGPIMGGSYNKSITQWSKGEYYDANNTQDDIAILTKAIGIVTDDFPNTPAGATTLAGTAAGIIAAGDTDIVSFTTFSMATISITTKGNLDAGGEILDASGNLAASLGSDDTPGLSASISLPQGHYFLRLFGTGFGSPMAEFPTGYTSYGSLGSYSVAIATNQAPYSQWAASFGIPEDPLADSDCNNIPNLHRYAFGITPMEPNQTDKLPRMATISTTHGIYATITYRNNPAAAVTYTVQESLDLKTWTAVTAPDCVVGSATNNDGTQNVTIRATMPVNTTPACFLRVSVSL